MDSSPHRDMVIATFSIGLLIGLGAATLYALAIRKFFVFGSVELFQTLAIFIFCAWVAPSARVLITLSLKGLERGDQTVEVLSSFKDDVKPLLTDAKELVLSMKGMNVQKFSDLADKVLKDGSIDRLSTALGTLVSKLEAKAVDNMMEKL